MAVSLIQSVGASQIQGASSTLTIPLAQAPAAGNILFLALVYNGSTALSLVGWTSLNFSVNSFGGASSQLFYRIADGTEGTSPALALGAVYAVAAVLQEYAGAAVPVYIGGGGTSISSTATFTSTAVVPVTADTVVIGVAASMSGSPTVASHASATPTTGWADAFQAVTSGAKFVALEILTQAGRTASTTPSTTWSAATLGNWLTVVVNPPAAPAAPTVNAPSGITPNRLIANWTPATPTQTASAPTSYALDYSTDSTFATGVTTLTGITGTAATLSGLAPGTTYYYRVRGVNAGGTGANSGTQAATTLAAPAVVRLQAATASQPGGATLTFTLPVAPVAGDFLIAHVGQAVSNATVSAPGWTVRSSPTVSASTLVILTRVADGTEGRNIAFAVSGNSYTNGFLEAWAGTRNALGGLTTPVTPGAATASTPAAVTPPGAASVVVGVHTNNASAGAQVSNYNNAVPTTGWTLRGAYYGSQSVVAIQQGGLTGAVTPGVTWGSSGQIVATSYTLDLVQAPNAPTVAAPTAVTATGFVANWAAPATDATHDAATTYALDYSTSPTFATGVTTIAGIAGTSQALAGLTPGTTYYYRVRASNDAGTSPVSTTQAATTATPDAAAPTNGLNLSLVTTGGKGGSGLAGVVGTAVAPVALPALTLATRAVALVGAGVVAPVARPALTLGVPTGSGIYGSSTYGGATYGGGGTTAGSGTNVTLGPPPTLALARLPATVALGALAAVARATLALTPQPAGAGVGRAVPVGTLALTAAPLGATTRFEPVAPVAPASLGLATLAAGVLTDMVVPVGALALALRPGHLPRVPSTFGARSALHPAFTARPALRRARLGDAGRAAPLTARPARTPALTATTRLRRT